MLVEAGEGGRVLTQLQEAGMACRVVEGRVAAAVTFFRVDPLSGEVRIGWHALRPDTEPSSTKEGILRHLRLSHQLFPNK